MNAAHKALLIMGLTTDMSSSRTCGWELYVYGSYRGGGQKIISDIRI